MEKNRLNWIDIAKGICMIAVFLGHLGVEKLGFVYSFHLTVFFILSGFTMKKAKLSAAYLKNKFGRLMASYFTTCFFVTVVEAGTLILKRELTHFAFTQLVYNNLLRTFFASGTFENMGETYFGRNIGAIWFLPAMFFAILFTQIILNITDNKKLQATFSIGIAVIGCISSKAVWLPFSIQSAMLAVPFILTGIYIREYNILDKIKPIHYLGFLLIFIAGCLTGKAQVFYIVVCALGDWIITPVCAFASSFLILGISKKINKFKPLEYIGKNSMIYLCVHLFEMFTLPPCYNKVFEILPIPDNVYTRFVLEFVAINVISFVIITFRGIKKKERKPLKINTNGDLSLDFTRGLLLVILLICRLVSDPQFNTFGINIEVILLTIISGYSFNKEKSLKRLILNCAETVIPYVIFVLGYILLTPNKDFVSLIYRLTNGVSNGESPATVAVVALPCVYLLYLFITKIIYTFISRINNTAIIHIISVTLGFIGFAVAEHLPKLPVRIDYILISLMIFHISAQLGGIKLLEKAKEMPFLCFPLSWVCCVALLSDKADISARITTEFGFTIFSLFCAFVIVYLLCSYINSRLPELINFLISLPGKSYGYILITASLLFSYISNVTTDKLNLYDLNVFYLVFVVVVEVAIGVLIYLFFNGIKYLLSKKVIK